MSALEAYLNTRQTQDKAEIHAYALVDCILDKEIYQSLEMHDVPRVSLYPDPSLESYAPYLVRIEEGSAFFALLLAGKFTEHWGYLLFSKHSLASLASHLSAYTKGYSEQHQQEIYLRFYDPRAIDTYFKYLSPSELETFCSPIESIVRLHSKIPFVVTVYRFDKHLERKNKTFKKELTHA